MEKNQSKRRIGIFISMLPKQFHLQNKKNRDKVLATLKLYTITYDYDLTKYYGEYIKDSYNEWGNIVDMLGVMKLTGYDKDEVEFNFHQIMHANYIDTKKLLSIEVKDIREELFINKSIL